MIQNSIHSYAGLRSAPIIHNDVGPGSVLQPFIMFLLKRHSCRSEVMPFRCRGCNKGSGKECFASFTVAVTVHPSPKTSVWVFGFWVALTLCMQMIPSAR